MPNVEAINGVIEAIKEEPRNFDMHRWAVTDDSAPCGTVMCIAGHAVHNAIDSKSWEEIVVEELGLWDTNSHLLAKLLDLKLNTSIIGIGAHLLGLNAEVARELFSPGDLSANADQAIEVLEWVRDFKGELDPYDVEAKWHEVLYPPSYEGGNGDD